MLNQLGVNLKGLYESEGAAATCAKLKAALDAGELKPSDFSLRELFEAFCGLDALKDLDPRAIGRRIPGVVLEEAVDSTAFSNITGQILYNRIMAGWQDADRGLMDTFVTTIPTVFNGEKIPGMTAIEDEGFEVHEGKEFPRTGFGEDYLETPATTKRGQIVEITKEAIFFDRTGLILQRAATVGERLAYDKLKRILKVVIGAVNNHKWKGTTYNTYQTATPWINKKASHTITDWTDLEEMELLWADMTNPDTGNPLEMPIRKQMLCTPHKVHTLRRIINATEVGSAPGATSGYDTRGGNPLNGYENPIASALFYALLQSALSISAANAKNVVIIGDFKKAFWYMENWAMTVVQAPNNDEPEFERDVVSRYKASERGVAFAREPRQVLWAQQHA